VSAPRELARGTRLADYRVEALLGRGGMSVVYLAEDLRLKRKVALKVLAPALADDERFRERFLRESELAASIDHANVIPIYEAGEADGSLFIAMRYVEGATLKLLLRDCPLPAERTIALVSQVASALDAAHARGLVHGDVKPSNVLVDRADHAYLADFGLTKRLADEHTPLGEPQVVGTIDYVAPEQIRGDEVDGRTDVYSLGCLLYECLTGEQPFQRRSDLAVLYAHLEDEPPQSGSPADPVVARALAKSPDERYQTCGELVEAARNALGIVAPRRPRWPVAVAALATVFAAAALLAFFLARGGSTTEPPGGRLLRIDPESNSVADSVAVGRNPTGVAVGGGRVWATTEGDSSVWRIDAKTLDTLRIPARGLPIGVSVSGDTAYVANTFGGGLWGWPGNVTRIATGSGATRDVVSTGAAFAVASGTEGVWLARYREAAQITDVSAVTGAVGERVAIPEASWEFPAIAVGVGAVWVLGNALDRRLWRIDPATRRVVASIPLPFAPASMAADDGAVWVTAQLDDEVARIDPVINRIVATVEVGREPLGVAVGEGAVWIANTIDGTVTRIDPATDRVVATIRLGSSPKAIAAAGGSVWVGADAR
jgi:YVTN family beta-propeller protein